MAEIEANLVEVFRQRAELYQQIRSYFQQQNVLEVEVPILGRTSALDPHLASMSLSSMDQTYYLQTSPEFFMKRLLANGSGSIFSIGKAFRDNESGRRHNPEFSMLEWYRVGFSLEELMQDVENLLRQLMPAIVFEYCSYSELFQSTLGLNPHSCSLSDINRAVAERTSFQGDLNRSSSLELLMSEVIEPSLSSFDAIFVTDFPLSQAAMAQTRIDSQGNEVAYRFELYMRGFEIANGYAELTDEKEQRRRFDADNQARQEIDLPTIPIDEHLLKAMEVGLPECAGVALGLDRLLWLLHSEGRNMDIRSTMLFPWDEL